MATRTSFAGTTNAGDVLHSADVTKLPGGWIGYVEKTVDQTGISSITDITSLSVTVTVGTSRAILIVGHFAVVEQQTSTGFVKGYIRESSTTLGTFVNQSVSAGARSCGEGSVYLTPSAGSHTYKLSLSTSAGTVDLVSNSADPGSSFILVEDLGPQ